jgi:phospholipid transport system transporter-binding protein
MEIKSFKPSQSMTFDTVQADCQRLHEFCHTNKESILNLHLDEVHHCDSAGLALLIEAKRLCGLQNKTCKITGMPKIIQALSKFCGVDEMLGLTD